MEGIADSVEKLCNKVEEVNGFCYLVDRLNASDGCEVAVTARVKYLLRKIQGMWRIVTWK